MECHAVLGRFTRLCRSWILGIFLGFMSAFLKPDNIMVSNDGVVKLMDFDIARTYDESKKCDTEHMGTVGYAAPEHFGFGQIDARSDIYSCGVVLNVLLTGKLPEEKLAAGILVFFLGICILVVLIDFM